ncbi:MAG: redoxin domain-containing protein [Deltaproteobacteria bacterium]|nr:redoxin domain-containing protein [Deltaproteobacteria bacterium]
MRQSLYVLAFSPLFLCAVAFADKERLDAGDEAPNFAAKTLNPDVAKTRVFTLDSVVGTEATDRKKAVLTSFVSATCESCQKELKFLQALYAEYKDKGLLVVGVSTDKEEGDTKKMAEQTAGIEFPVINDRFNIVAQRYFVTKPPQMYIIDESGKVAKVSTSYDDAANRGTLDEVRKNLGLSVSEDPPPSLQAFMMAPKNDATPVAATTGAIPKTDPAPAALEAPKKGAKGKKAKEEKTVAAAPAAKKVVGKPPPKAAPPPPAAKGPKRIGRKP